MRPQIYNARVQLEKNNIVMRTITPTHGINQNMHSDIYRELINPMSVEVIVLITVLFFSG